MTRGPGPPPAGGAGAGRPGSSRHLGPGAILRSCLFSERNRKNRARPIPAKTRKPSSRHDVAGRGGRGQDGHWLTLSRTPANRSSSGNSVSTTDLARW